MAGTARKFMTIGTDVATGEPCSLTDDEAVRHLFVCGSTGSGKTELLLGLSANAIAAGSGMLFVDGKGDPSTFAKIYALAARFGRQDEVVLVNFLGKEGRTNALNPFAKLSATDIVQMLVDMMPVGGGDHAFWRDRAVAMIDAVVPAAVWLRDQGAGLDAVVLRDMFKLEKVIDLVDPLLYPDVPAAVRDGLEAYLASLPGYNPEKKRKQSSVTCDQHGYLHMQVTKVFTSFVVSYPSVFMAGDEVDIHDIVASGRIAVILLPALAKSAAELGTLGRMTVAMFKNALGRLLDVPVEGEWDEVVGKRPTDGRPPFVAVFDEVGHYLTPGMGLMASQARSLNVCLVFGTQDMETMGYSDPREKAAILSNTVTKVFMKSVSSDWGLKNSFEIENETRKAERTRASDIVGYARYTGRPWGQKKDEIEKAAEWLLNREPLREDYHLRLPGFGSGDMAVMRDGVPSLVKAFHASADLGGIEVRLNRFSRKTGPSSIAHPRRPVERRGHAESLAERRWNKRVAAAERQMPQHLRNVANYANPRNKASSK
jgi:hypothetical protein